MSSEEKKCPMCGESLWLGYDLQLHYLTRCKGYDKKSDEPGGESVNEPAPNSTSSLPKKESKREVSTPKTRATYLVKFLWRPVTQPTFKKVTLLSNFQVEMMLDAQNGYYISDMVEASEGEFDGQFVIGRTYRSAIKKFVVDKTSTTIELELDVSKVIEAESERYP